MLAVAQSDRRTIDWLVGAADQQIGQECPDPLLYLDGAGRFASDIFPSDGSGRGHH